MSLILKGIDMPKEHGYIDITIFGDGETYYEYNTIDSGEYQTTAVQIDRPHGRLIDENLTYIDKTIDGYFEIYAPTILEAEE